MYGLKKENWNQANALNVGQLDGIGLKKKIKVDYPFCIVFIHAVFCLFCQDIPRIPAEALGLHYHKKDRT
jgi:hypothetical protein